MMGGEGSSSEPRESPSGSAIGIFCLKHKTYLVGTQKTAKFNDQFL